MIKDNKEYQILIIDDNKGDRVLLEAYLEDTVLLPKITEIESYHEAKTLLKDTSQQFDVVLLDLGLPDLGGEELIRSIIEQLPKTPVIVLTGYPDIEFSRKSLKLGVSDYLLKDDLNSSILYKSILYAIERKKVSNQLINSEKRYRELFELSPMPVVVFDELTHAFLAVNAAAVQTYGYSKEEFFCMEISQIHSISNSEEIFHKGLPMQNENSSQSGVFRHKKKNNEWIDVEVFTNAIEFNGKDAKVFIINDITFKNRYIEAIETQNAKLKEIAWIQSHVVRAPLSRMLGLIGLVATEEDSTNLTEDQKNLIHLIRESAHELDDIIREIAKKTEQIKIN
jgi:PAS domain S-box-containing protein